MNTIEIKTIDDLITGIRNLISQNNLKTWFRGQADKDWDLIPAAKRPPFTGQEQFLTNDFYIKAKNRMKNPPQKGDYSGWLSLMQHYGLPTRLLDWSKSPLIAAYFAIWNYKKYPEKDACIWAMHPSILNRYEDFGDYLYPMDNNSVIKLLIPAFKTVKTTDKVIACWSVENDLRMFVQQAAFTVHDSNVPLNKMGVNNLLTRFIIPRNLKQKFLHDLAICGFLLSDIFPDIESVSFELKNSHK